MVSSARDVKVIGETPVPGAERVPPESTRIEPVGPNFTIAPGLIVSVTPLGISSGQVTTMTGPLVHVVLPASVPHDWGAGMADTWAEGVDSLAWVSTEVTR